MLIESEMQKERQLSGAAAKSVRGVRMLQGGSRNNNTASSQQLVSSSTSISQQSCVTPSGKKSPDNTILPVQGSFLKVPFRRPLYKPQSANKIRANQPSPNAQSVNVLQQEILRPKLKPLHNTKSANFFVENNAIKIRPTIKKTHTSKQFDTLRQQNHLIHQQSFTEQKQKRTSYSREQNPLSHAQEEALYQRFKQNSVSHNAATISASAIIKSEKREAKTNFLAILPHPVPETIICTSKSKHAISKRKQKFSNQNHSQQRKLQGTQIRKKQIVISDVIEDITDEQIDGINREMTEDQHDLSNQIVPRSASKPNRRKLTFYTPEGGHEAMRSYNYQSKDVLQTNKQALENLVEIDENAEEQDAKAVKLQQDGRMHYIDDQNLDTSETSQQSDDSPMREKSLTREEKRTKDKEIKKVLKQRLNIDCLRMLGEESFKGTSSFRTSSIINENSVDNNIDDSYDLLMKEIGIETNEGLSNAFLQKNGEALKQKLNSFTDMFDVRDILGVGAFGVVLLVKNKKTKEKSALKIIAKEKLSKSAQKILRNESTIMQTMDHPAIVSLKRIFENQKFIIIEMEFIPGGQLKRLFSLTDAKDQFQPISDLQASKVMRSLLKGVSYVHARDIIHRDLKPENILLENDEDLCSNVKIVDFGLSAEQNRRFEQNFKAGTLVYMAPEQAMRKGYSKKIDLWACGIIAFQLLSCGQHPFFNKGDTNFCKKLENIDTQPIQWSFSDQFSSLAKDFILNLCAYPPSNRYDANTALQHPWITRNESHEIPLNHDQKLALFQKEHQLRKVMRLACFSAYVKMSTYQATQELIPEQKSGQYQHSLFLKNSFRSYKKLLLGEQENENNIKTSANTPSFQDAKENDMQNKVPNIDKQFDGIRHHRKQSPQKKLTERRKMMFQQKEASELLASGRLSALNSGQSCSNPTFYNKANTIPAPFNQNQQNDTMAANNFSRNRLGSQGSDVRYLITFSGKKSENDRTENYNQNNNSNSSSISNQKTTIRVEMLDKDANSVPQKQQSAFFQKIQQDLSDSKSLQQEQSNRQQSSNSHNSQLVLESVSSYDDASNNSNSNQESGIEAKPKIQITALDKNSNKFISEDGVLECTPQFSSTKAIDPQFKTIQQQSSPILEHKDESGRSSLNPITNQNVVKQKQSLPAKSQRINYRDEMTRQSLQVLPQTFESRSDQKTSSLKSKPILKSNKLIGKIEISTETLKQQTQSQQMLPLQSPNRPHTQHQHHHPQHYYTTSKNNGSQNNTNTNQSTSTAPIHNKKSSVSIQIRTIQRKKANLRLNHSNSCKDTTKQFLKLRKSPKETTDESRNHLSAKSTNPSKQISPLRSIEASNDVRNHPPIDAKMQQMTANHIHNPTTTSLKAQKQLRDIPYKRCTSSQQTLLAPLIQIQNFQNQSQFCKQPIVKSVEESQINEPSKASQEDETANQSNFPAQIKQVSSAVTTARVHRRKLSTDKTSSSLRMHISDNKIQNSISLKQPMIFKQLSEQSEIPSYVKNAPIRLPPKEGKLTQRKNKKLRSICGSQTLPQTMQTTQKMVIGGNRSSKLGRSSDQDSDVLLLPPKSAKSRHITEKMSKTKKCLKKKLLAKQVSGLGIKGVQLAKCIRDSQDASGADHQQHQQQLQ